MSYVTWLMPFMLINRSESGLCSILNDLHVLIVHHVSSNRDIVWILFTLIKIPLMVCTCCPCCLFSALNERQLTPVSYGVLNQSCHFNEQLKQHLDLKCMGSSCISNKMQKKRLINVLCGTIKMFCNVYMLWHHRICYF